MEEESLRFYGFVDMQVNGAMGVDIQNPDSLNPESLMELCRYQWQNGVVKCYPTIISNSDEVILAVLQKIFEARRSSELVAATIPGVHLEIYVSSKANGCHNLSFLRRLDWQFIESLRHRSLVKIITLAPELPGSSKFIKEAVKAGIRVGIGHTMANYQTIVEACRIGASFSTHLGNGIPPMLFRNENTIVFQLAQEEKSATFIADLCHLSEAALKVYIKAKRVERSIIITDSIAATGMGNGEFSFAGQPIVVKDGWASLKGAQGILAGSVTTMLQSFSNLQKCGFGVPEIIRMMSYNPRTLLGLEDGTESCYVRMETSQDTLPKIEEVLIGGKRVI